MLITFQAFRTAINTLVFPDAQAEQRVPLFRNFIVNGLIQMTTFVESYQSVNVNFYDKDQSFDDCGLSILQGCRGQIGAVYAFKPSCRCQRYFYEPASLEKLSCLYERCRCEAAAACCGQTTSVAGVSVYTQNPYYCGDYIGGNQGCTPPYLAAQPEDDCAFKASERYFAIGPNQKIWLYPRFPCGHILGVHWRGIRRAYLDNDYVPDDDDLKDAIACYVECEVARRVDKDQATADKLYADYRMKIGDIIFREEQDLRPRATRVCIEGLDQSELVQIYPVNLYPVEVGETCATSSSASVADVATPALTLDIESTASNVIVDWTQATEPGTNEVWKSVNGGAYALVASIDGSLETYADANPMPGGDVWCYKVRGKNGGTNGQFSNIGCAVKDMIFLGSVVDQPTWMMAFGDFASDDVTLVASLNFPALKRVTGRLFMDGSTLMTSVSLTALQIVDLAIHLSGSLTITSISLPALTTINGQTATLVQYNGITPTMIQAAILFDGCTALTTVSIPTLVFQNGQGYQFDACALSAASVNHILSRAVASGVTSCFITLDGGTNAAPTGQGIVDKAALLLAGNSVSTN